MTNQRDIEDGQKMSFAECVLRTKQRLEDRANRQDVRPVWIVSALMKEILESDSIPRRNRLDLSTPAELKIRDTVNAVEEAGCHPLLTDAVVLLHMAREKVADFVDGIDTPSIQDAKDAYINHLETEVERLKSGLDDIEKIVHANQLKQVL